MPVLQIRILKLMVLIGTKALSTNKRQSWHSCPLGNPSSSQPPQQHPQHTHTLTSRGCCMSLLPQGEGNVGIIAKEACSAQAQHLGMGVRAGILDWSAYPASYLLVSTTSSDQSTQGLWLKLQVGIPESPGERPETGFYPTLLLPSTSQHSTVTQWPRICCCCLVPQSCPTLSMGFPRQENWSGLPFPSPGDLSGPGIESGSPVLWAGSLPSEPPSHS